MDFSSTVFLGYGNKTGFHHKKKWHFLLQNLLAISVTVEDTSNSFVFINCAMDGKESIPPGINFGLVYTCSQLHE